MLQWGTTQMIPASTSRVASNSWRRTWRNAHETLESALQWHMTWALGSQEWGWQAWSRQALLEGVMRMILSNCSPVRWVRHANERWAKVNIRRQLTSLSWRVWRHVGSHRFLSVGNVQEAMSWEQCCLRKHLVFLWLVDDSPEFFLRECIREKIGI